MTALASGVVAASSWSGHDTRLIVAALTGIAVLAVLSVPHGLVPPHPGPLAAISTVKADLGVTLGLGLLVAVPTVVVAGPIFGRLAARWVDATPPSELMPEYDDKDDDATGSATVATISAAGIVAPLAAGLSSSRTALLVPAIGS